MSDQSTQGVLSPFLVRQRIKAALPFIEGSVLDFGCGAGPLANHIPPAQYHGCDINEAYIAEARRLHPDHRFSVGVPEGPFDTFVALAVIEHMDNPNQMMKAAGGAGFVVFTTPRPTLEWAHDLGSRVGLFSRDAHDEHVSHLDESAIRELALDHDRLVVEYRRFLWGANQLAVLA